MHQRLASWGIDGKIPTLGRGCGRGSGVARQKQVRRPMRWEWVAACLTWVGFTHAAPPAAPPEIPVPILALPEVELQPAGRSQVPFVVGIELAWAKAILEERVPILLHQEKNREVGSGIGIDVKVTRGAIDVQVGAETIRLKAPIEADINVRSRLGSYVLPLGSCRPIIDAEVSASLQLSADGKLSQPTAKANLRTPCRLSGFDVTPLLQAEIERQLTHGRSQAAQHLDQANSVVAELHRETMRRIAGHAAGCLRFVPDRFLQGPIFEERGLVVTRLVADGMLLQHCAPVTASPMRAAQTRDPGGLQLIWQRQVTWPDLDRAILDHLRGSGTSAIDVRLRSAKRDGKELVAIFVRMASRKGWLFSSPQVVDGNIRLTNLESTDAELLQTTHLALESFSLPVDKVAILVLAQRLVAESNQLTQVFGRSPDVKQSFAIQEADLQTLSEVRIDRDGLTVVVRRQQVVSSAVK